MSHDSVEAWKEAFRGKEIFDAAETILSDLHNYDQNARYNRGTDACHLANALTAWFSLQFERALERKEAAE